MAILKGVEVRVALNTSGKAESEKAGVALPDYPGPNMTNNGAETLIERYIEAFSGRSFQIEVFFQPDFELHRAHGVAVEVDIDNEAVRVNQFFTAEQVATSKDTGVPLIISSAVRVREEKHYAAGLTFGSLQPQEDSDIDMEQADIQAKRLAKIEVEVARATLKKLERPETNNAHKMNKPDISSQIPKELYKERNIRHYSMPGVEEEITPVGMITEEYVPIRRRGWKYVTFIFRYRDHSVLQMLGCIPKNRIEAGPGSEVEPISIEENSAHRHNEDPSTNSNQVRLQATRYERLQIEYERLAAMERKYSRLERENETLSQENAILKARKDPSTAATEDSINVTSLATMRVNQEPGEGPSGSSSTRTARRATRSRTNANLD